MKNFVTNLTNLGTAIGTFFADPTRGFEFEWTPLLKGFEATAAALPELVKPHLTDLTKEIEAQAKQLGDNILARGDAAKNKAANARAKQEEGAKKKPKEAKQPEEYGFAEFARKLGTQQFSKTDETVKENTKAVKDNREAIERNTAALARGGVALFA